MSCNDQHLAVTRGAGANADGGDGKGLRNFGAQIGGDAFQHQRETADFFQAAGFVFEALPGVAVAALNFVAPDLVDRLGRQPRGGP